MTRLQDLVGKESDLREVSQSLRSFAQDLDASTVGACHVTCSDEAEWECAEAFQHWFARELLPNLKADHRGSFRSSNLGGRYELGSISIAEGNFACAATPDMPKLMVVKINAHVGVMTDSDQGSPRYGFIERYGCQSACCGAMASVFTDSQVRAVSELREAFRTGGYDRLAVLSDPLRGPE